MLASAMLFNLALTAHIALVTYNVQGLFRGHDFRDQQRRPLVTAQLHKLTDAAMAKSSQAASVLVLCLQEIFELSRQTYAKEMKKQAKRPLETAIAQYFETEFTEDYKTLVGFKCKLLGTNKALATVICYRKGAVSLRHLRNLKYVYNEDELPGQANPYSGKMFPFKGGLITELLVDNMPFNVLNLHLSSKNIENRRKQITEILQKYYGSEMASQHGVLLMAGDMNARTGSNYRLDGVNALEYYKGGSILKNFLRGCLEMIHKNVEFSIHNWNRGNCLDLIDFVDKHEEMTMFFSVPLAVSSSIHLAAREIGKRRFMPTFCYDKNKQYVKREYVENYRYDCHKTTENTVSWPDRIFVVTNKNLGKHRYHVETEAYDSMKLPISDHMPVFSTFKLSEPCLLSRDMPDFDAEV